MTDSRSLTTTLARMGVDPITWRVMGDLHPGADDRSKMMILRYCIASQMDALRSPVVVLTIDGKQVPVLSIHGLRAHAVRTGAYAGSRLEYSDQVEEIDNLLSLPTWCRCIVSRVMADGSRAEFEGQVWAREAVGRKRDGTITKMWRTRGMHMLGISAERLALRRAFPESVPPDDTAPAREMIDPETGEIHGQAPQHLSDEDIASGLERLEGGELDESNAEWIDAFDNAG